MSDVSIRAALETRLAALNPPLDTAHENEAYTPVTDTPYQRVHLLPAQPDTPEVGGGPFKVLSGLLQVTLFYPQGKGPGAAAARAELLRSWFPRALSLGAGGVTVTIDGAPYVMSGFEDGDRWAIPVRIPYYANISS